MDAPSIFIGIISLAYGFFTLYARIKKPALLGKLQVMQNRFGHKPGGLIHLLVYTILPLVAGGLILKSGLMGQVVY